MSMILAFTGKKGSGKDTCADLLKQYLNYVGLHDSYKHINFADKVRAACKDLFGLTYVEMTDPVIKEETLERWPHQSPRFIMQRFATEGIRSHWPDLWIHHWTLEVERTHIQNPQCMIITTDMRFPNERARLEDTCLRLKRKPLVVNVLRPSIDTGDTHESEAYAGKLGHDFEILNDGTIDDLKNSLIQKVMEHGGIDATS